MEHLSEFINLAFATFIVWEWLASLSPIRIHPQLQPVLVVLAAYGINKLPEQPWLIPIAAAGGVALLHRWLSPEAGDPITIPKPRLPRLRRRSKNKNPAVGNRVPKL